MIEDQQEAGRDNVRSLWPRWNGLHMCCNGHLDNGMQRCESELNLKVGPSSDCKLKLICMKLESLVIADHHAAVNLFLNLVHTARHATKTGGGRRRLKTERQEKKKNTHEKYGLTPLLYFFFFIRGLEVRQSVDSSFRNWGEVVTGLW